MSLDFSKPEILKILAVSPITAAALLTILSKIGPIFFADVSGVGR